MTVEDVIASVLDDTYGRSAFTAGCATVIADRLPKWRQDAKDRDFGRSVEDHVMLCVWDWFPGGSTAEVAAMRVMAALKEHEESDASEGV